MNINQQPVLLGAKWWERVGSAVMDSVRGSADAWNRLSRPHVVQENPSIPSMDPTMTGLVIAGAIGIAGFALMKKKRRI